MNKEEVRGGVGGRALGAPPGVGMVPRVVLDNVLTELESA